MANGELDKMKGEAASWGGRTLAGLTAVDGLWVALHTGIFRTATLIILAASAGATATYGAIRRK